MAAGLTDHVWTMDELLSFRVPPKSLWRSPFTRYRDITSNRTIAENIWKSVFLFMATILVLECHFYFLPRPFG